MPGYYVHSAVYKNETRKNISFVRGVETPDLLKTYYKSSQRDINKVEEKYNKIKTKDMPDFSRFAARVQQQEEEHALTGMHYGWSSNPNYEYFLYTLTEEEKRNPFWRGYLWHLLTDLVMYEYLGIQKKYDDFIDSHKDDENLKKLLAEEYKKLHSDWDKTNAIIRATYPDVTLTPEVIELNIVKFIESKNLNDVDLSYVDLNTVLYCIDFLRGLDPINQDINELVENIKNFISEKDKFLGKKDSGEKSFQKIIKR